MKHGGVTLADTSQPVLLFKAGLRARYYIPAEDVAIDHLVLSPSETACPYNGTGSYWSVEVGENVTENLAWSYADPLPECGVVKGLPCVHDDKVEEFSVDGEPAA
ncbi:MAG: DUF427 domain-containing protein [Rhodospirillaceae bacterium]|nr:DUF427 domain-containing protein [Rhodospirillaceae bacterium]